MTAIKVNELTEKRIVDALTKQMPMKPIEHELGGGVYFTCHWVACGETVYRWMNYCPLCGSRILWDDE